MSDSGTTVVVLGAGGRAGRTVSRELSWRGHRVVGMVRDVARFEALSAVGGTAASEVVEGDATRATDVAGIVSGADAVVVAVTPFSAPPESFDGFDESFYERVLDAVLAGARPGTRLITVGLFATLTTPEGTMVMDDPALFPAPLRPFARAHGRELPLLRERATRLDWMIATPPAGLHLEPTRPAPHVLAATTLPTADITSPLGYDQLAVAIVDEIDWPTVHRRQVAVLNGPGATRRDG